MELKNIRLKPRDIKAVQFTGHNHSQLKEWVQGVLSFQNVVSTEDKLYLPTDGGVDILEPGDWVLYDPADKVFRGATDDAIQNFYEEV